MFKARTGNVHDAAVRNAVEPVMATLGHLPHVVSVSSPYDPRNSRFLARGGTIAYAEIMFDVQANDVPLDLGTKMREIVNAANTNHVQMELGGTMFTDQTQPASEVVGVLAAIVILVLLALGFFGRRGRR